MPVLAALCLRKGDRMLGSILVLAGGGARAALASAFCAGPCAAELAVPSACPLQEVCGSHCRAAFSAESLPMCNLPSAWSHIANTGVGGMASCAGVMKHAPGPTLQAEIPRGW